jgi:hypothetical protein
MPMPPILLPPWLAPPPTNVPPILRPPRGYKPPPGAPGQGAPGRGYGQAKPPGVRSAGAATVRVRGERLPLTPEGLRKASPGDVSRALLKDIRAVAERLNGR